MCITNHGKTTCQLQASIQIAKAFEVDFDLNNKDSKSITSDCWEEAPCEPHKDLKQTPPNEMDVNIPIEDHFKLRMVSLLSDGKVFSNERIAWRQKQLISTFVDSENGVSEEESLQLKGF